MPCSGAGRRVQEMSGAAGAGGWVRGDAGVGRLRAAGTTLHLCLSTLSSFLAARYSPSLACLPRLWALRPALSQLHTSHRHTRARPGWRQAAGAPGPAPCKPCPTSQVASSAANPWPGPPRPLPRPPLPPQVRQPGPGRPSRWLPRPARPPLRGHHAPAQAWRLTPTGTISQLRFTPLTYG